MPRPYNIPVIIRHLIWTSIVLTTAVGTLSAQEEPEQKILFDKFYNKPEQSSSLRNLINKFSLGVSTGYGRTTYKHKFSGVGIMQIRDSVAMIFSSQSEISDNELTKAYLNWFNFVIVANDVPIDRSRNDFLVNSDTAQISYKATARGIPLHLTLNYSFDRYRIGLGASFEFHKINDFKPLNFTDSLQAYQPNVNRATFKRYFLTFGGRVYSYYDYFLFVDTQIGILNLGGSFPKSVINRGIYFNLGLSIEREFSEYFTAFVRPSYELKGFTTNLPEGLSVAHRQPTFFINIGTYLKLPEYPKCKIKKCQIQINHTHGGGKNWRSRMHPFFKKQNPHYGENFPKLLKDKRKNKKKINPF